MEKLFKEKCWKHEAQNCLIIRLWTRLESLRIKLRNLFCFNKSFSCVQRQLFILLLFYGARVWRSFLRLRCRWEARWRKFPRTCHNGWSESHQAKVIDFYNFHDLFPFWSEEQQASISCSNLWQERKEMLERKNQFSLWRFCFRDFFSFHFRSSASRSTSRLNGFPWTTLRFLQHGSTLIF